MAIYHTAIGFPRWLKGTIPTGKKQLAFTQHARTQCQDKYAFQLPSRVVASLGDYDIIEVSTNGKVITKMVARSKSVVRTEYNLCMAIIPSADKGVWVVKTAWLNHKDDNHKTLDVSRFSK